MHDPIISTVDVVLLTLIDDALHVALVTRDNPDEPFCGALALPGGYIHANTDDSVREAAARVLLSKAGIASPYLEEFGTVSGPLRDPRGWSLTVVHFALVAPNVLLAPKMRTIPVSKLPSLAFDHKEIIARVVERVRSKSTYSTLPMFLCPDEFTIPQLHAVHELLKGEPVPMASFRRKLDELDVIEVVKNPSVPQAVSNSRPPTLYRLKAKYRDSLAIWKRGL
jgi:8-oxo-dGTP diphosphatase